MIRAFTFFVLLLPLHLHAIEIGIPQLPLWAKSNHTGVAFELLKLIDQNSLKTIPYQTKGQPLVRAIGDYIQAKTDCFLGADEVVFGQFYGMQIISSQSIKPSAILAFTLPGQDVINSFEGFKKSPAGIPFGGDIAAALLKQYAVPSMKGKDFQQLMSLLKRRRISAIVAPDLERYNHPELQFSKNFSVLSYTDRLHCHPSAAAEKFIANFNIGLSNIQKNGQLQQLFSSTSPHAR